MSDIDLKTWLGFLGKEYFLQEFEVDRADISAQAPKRIERLDAVDENEIKVRRLIADGVCLNISQLEVNGSDITSLGASGRQVGEILDKLLALVVDEKTPNEKSELIKCAKKMLK